MELTIYNSSGEAVRHLVLNGPFKGAASLEVPDGVFDPSGSMPLDIKVWGQPVPWDGRNDTGQPISNGVYYVKLSYRDNTYALHVLEATATAQNSSQVFSLKVYNPAGELVRSLASAQPYSLAPGPLKIADPVLFLGLDGNAAHLQAMDLGSQTMEWDGRNNLGQSVQSGRYLVELEVYGQASGQARYEAGVTVINSASGRDIQGLVLAPNPVVLGQDRQLSVYLPLEYRDRVWAGLYTVAGGLAAQFDFSPAEGVLKLDLDQHHLAPGIYLVEVRALNAGGRQATAHLKVALR